MEGSGFVVRHVDVSVAAPDTIWRWRGWACTDPRDHHRHDRTVDVYKDSQPEPMPVATYQEPLSAELSDALALVEWAAASTINGAQDAWRPTLGALRSARRGSFKQRSLPQIKRSSRPKYRHRPQPVRLHKVVAEVSNVWGGSSVRISATRTRIELLSLSDSLSIGDLPPQIQKALRYGGEAMRQSAGLQLAAAARVLSGRVPSHDHIGDLLVQAQARRLNAPLQVSPISKS